MKPRIFKSTASGYWIVIIQFPSGFGAVNLHEIHDTWEEALESVLETQTTQEPTC